MQAPHAATRANYRRARDAWFQRGRATRGRRPAELRKQAYETKLGLRAQRAAALATSQAVTAQISFSQGAWIPLGPAPLASDATGNGTVDYGQVAGRATAIAIDPADPTGNTVYIGGAQSGIWKSTNAATSDPKSVTWTPVSDDQATLAIGALAIQPGNSDVTRSLILAATGESNNSGDSYFGLGILRSTDAGNTWSLTRTASSGTLSFAGLSGARMAFSTVQTSTVVAAMATNAEAIRDNLATSATRPGLYTSRDAGQTWTYNALMDSGVNTDPTSATSVVYNSTARLFFAAVRYHGIYSSPDGITWARLAVQPGAGQLSATACPPQSTSNNRACPIYRGEIAVLPDRNEMYVWYVYFDSAGSIADGGIWQSTNGGASWNSISDSGIANCGDFDGCGVEDGDYNLSLAAVDNGSATDLYAGATNLYKCTLTALNPKCISSPFMNLTHAYGCMPIAAPAHVHPAQHGIAWAIPSGGNDSGNELLYFANDGGIYRALDGYMGLSSGACSGTNQFEDLNEKLGSMTQFVSLAQHATDVNTLFGGAQGNGFPATSQATTNPNWWNAMEGGGGYTAIDPTALSNWYASNPDLPPGGLNIQLCSNGANCKSGGFASVVTSSTLGGDDGPFYVPFTLDWHSSTALLVGTCRVWRGPRSGGVYTALSPNFDTLGSGPCSGSEVNQVLSIAAGGNTDQYGSSYMYATTSGLGPQLSSTGVPGGRVWVTGDASGGPSMFADTTDNGPQGNINPNQFPVSSVGLDLSDPTGHTAYVTIQGFTGGPGHVWKTTDGGMTWTDFTGNLPDSPVNAAVVYSPMGQVFVGTDVGVFASSTSTPNWTELGPDLSTNTPGFLPNVAVTGLSIFGSGGFQLLRAATYGRGIWQFNLVLTPDFQVTVSNAAQTVFAGQSAVFSGTVSALNGYSNDVFVTCTAGSTSPPSTCSGSPYEFAPGSNSSFQVNAAGSPGDYDFKVQVGGSDSLRVTHSVPVTLHLVAFGLTTPTPPNVSVTQGNTSQPVSFEVTADGSLNQSVSVSCTTDIPGAACNLTPSTPVSPTEAAPVSMAASVSVPGGTMAGTYAGTLQAMTNGAPSSLTTSFTINVEADSDFALSPVNSFPTIKAGSQSAVAQISVASQGGFADTVGLNCSVPYPTVVCYTDPSSVSAFPTTSTVTLNLGNLAPGAYSMSVTGVSGPVAHALPLSFNIGDYSISGPSSMPAIAGGQVDVQFTLTSAYGYTGNIKAICDSSALAASMCTVSPANPVLLAGGGTAKIIATVNIPNDAIPGNYSIKLSTSDAAEGPVHSVSFSVNLAQDFRLISSTASQTVTAGQTSGPYHLAIQPLGASFDAAVSVACTAGLPNGAQCSFNPNTPQTPGSSAVDIVLTISTATAKANQARASNALLLSCGVALLFPALILLPRKSQKRSVGILRSLCVVSLLLLIASCAGVTGQTGGGSGGGGDGGSGGTPVTYHVTVTGTSQGTPADAGQSLVVTLVVN